MSDPTSDYLKFEEAPPPEEEVASSSSEKNPESSRTIEAGGVEEDCDCFYIGEAKSGIKMTKLKFSANISTMFTDYPFLQRFKKAKEAGFTSIEIQNPYLYTIEELVAARQDLKIDLVNSYNGKHRYGCAATPGLEDDFTNSMQEVIKYEFALGFKKLHIMCGMRIKKFTEEEQMETLIKNLKNLVASDLLENRTAVVEPLSPAVKEDYFLNSFKQAIKIIEAVKSPQIKLLLDVFHLEEIHGHISRFLPRYYEYAGHIQVSQSPGRGLPFSDGNINYDDVFNYLQRQGHSDFIGLECFSSGKEDYSAFVKGCW